MLDPLLTGLALVLVGLYFWLKWVTPDRWRFTFMDFTIGAILAIAAIVVLCVAIGVGLFGIDRPRRW